jgi:hypothetical protein
MTDKSDHILTKEKIKICESKEKKDKLMKELADISQQFNFFMDCN